MGQVKELIKAEPGTNEYRTYRLVQEGAVFHVYTGRAGTEPVPIATKQMRDWDTVVKRKEKEGFVERTALISVKCESKYAEIEDPQVRELIGFLMQVTRLAIDRAYSITSIEEVTPAMINRAQEIIDEISGNRERGSEWLNGRLVELFTVTPRRTRDLAAELISPALSVDEVLEREQGILDALASQVHIASQGGKSGRQTVLESFGVKMRPVTAKEEAQIKRHMDKESRGRYVRAFCVSNESTEARFRRYMERRHMTDSDVHFLYHGSRSENWLGLISEGPKIHANAVVTGKALGDCIYFADKFRKSAGYADSSYWTGGGHSAGDGVRRLVAVYKVAYNNPRHLHDTIMQFTAETLRPHDVAYLHGGGVFINSEFGIFDPDQVTIKYLIEFE